MLGPDEGEDARKRRFLSRPGIDRVAANAAGKPRRQDRIVVVFLPMKVALASGGDYTVDTIVLLSHQVHGSRGQEGR
jgi:hypothetical protein